MSSWDKLPVKNNLEHLRAELERSLNQPQMTDMEIALILAQHIENPCGFDAPSGERLHIRDFYMRKASEVLATFTNPAARWFLEDKIKEHQGKND